MSFNSLGEKIAELRKQFNLTQTDLAKKIGKSTSTVAMWETGQRDPDTEMLVTLAELFKVSSDYLLGIVAEKNLHDFLEQIEERSFGFFLKKLRLENGFKTKKSLADISGISLSTISRIEGNDQQPFPKTIEELSKYLKGYSREELLAAAGWFDESLGNFLSSVENDEFLQGVVKLTPLEKVEFYRRTNPDKVNSLTYTSEKNEFEAFINNPDHGLFFKDYLEAPEERKKEMLQFWRFIKDVEAKKEIEDK